MSVPTVKIIQVLPALSTALYLMDFLEGRYCESCSDSYYRPAGVSPSDSSPCTPCNCHSTGSTGPVCVKVWTIVLLKFQI